MGITMTNPGSPLTVGGGSGSKIYGYNNIGTAPGTVAPANTSRQSISFHNPGTIDIFVAPASVVNSGSFVALVPSISALGGCFRIYANGGTLTITGECQNLWQGFAASGSTNALTVMDTNV